MRDDAPRTKFLRLTSTDPAPRVSNYHVIENSSEVIVTTNNNKEYEAEIIGFDEVTDIAVVKIKSKSNLDYIFFGDSDSTLIGEWVLAVGNPYNLNSTVTAGIISSKSRDLNEYDQINQSFIQTDAAVNVGNSGGALVNINGELIGINTAIISKSGGYMGIGFAIPSNPARRIIPDLIAHGYVQRPWLGVEPIPTRYLRRAGLSVPDGVLVARVVAGTAAGNAGLRGADREIIIGRYRVPWGGDILTKLDGETLSNVEDLARIIDVRQPGEILNITFVRDSKTYRTKLS